MINEYRNPMTPLGSALKRAAAPTAPTADTALMARAMIAAGKARRAEAVTAEDEAALAHYSGAPVTHNVERLLSDAERAEGAQAILRAGRIARGEEEA